MKSLNENLLKKRILPLALGISISLSAASLFATSQTNIADVSALGSSISVTDNTGSENVILRVSGGSLEQPIESRSQNGSTYIDVGGLDDGLYNYDVLAVNSAAEEGGSGSVERQSGSFEVSNGSIVKEIEETLQKPSNDSEDGVGNVERSILEKVAISILEFTMPTAHAADLVTDNTVTSRLYFRQSGTNKWQFLSSSFGGINDDALGLFNHSNNRYVMSFKNNTAFNVNHGANDYVINSGAGGTTGLTGVAPTFLSLSSNAANENAIIADSSGDISFADGSVFIDDSVDRVGIDTTTPVEELHIVDGDATIRLDGGTNYYNIMGGNDDYQLAWNDAGTNKPIMTVEDDPCGDLTGGGCIGFFNAENPEAPFHIERNDGETQMLIEESGGTTANRTMIRMINNGGPNMSFQDTSNGIGWQFAQTTAGDFAVSKEFSGGSEFIVQGDGRVRMGPGPTTNFDLRANGDLFIPNGNIRVMGTNLNVPDYVFADDYKLMSLDDLKTFVETQKHLPNVPSEAEIKAAKTLDLGGTAMTHLEKIEELTLYTLQQHEQIKALQTENKTLAQKVSEQTTALRSENKTLAQKVSEQTTVLKSENDALKQRLASLEKLVTNIASSGNTLSATGEKVAVNLSK